MLTDFEYGVICSYLNQLAINWWSTQSETKKVAICDACSNNQIDRNRGYLIGSNLWCQECFNRKAEPMIHRDPNSAGDNTLEKAMNLLNEKERIEKKRIEELAQKRTEAVLKNNDEKNSLIIKRKETEHCIFCGKSFNFFSRLFENHSNCNHIILSNGINGFLIDSRDGQEYKTVKIGNQIMMAENLRYKMSSGCWIYDNKEEYVKEYGYLYDWKTACESVKGLKGWHLPTKEEYESLHKCYFGGSKKDYYALRENGSSGFDAILCGACGSQGLFGLYGQVACFWSATSYSDSEALFFSVPRYATPGIKNFPKVSGISVRLFRDL